MGRNVIGVIRGEGVGPEIVSVALDSISEIEKISGKEFEIIDFDGKAPSTGRDHDDAYSQLKRFYFDIRDKQGVILRSSLHASLVYKLREDFNFLYKLIPIQPVAELASSSVLKSRVRDNMRLLLIRDNSQGLYHGLEEPHQSESGKSIQILSSFSEGKIRELARASFSFAQQRRKVLHLLIKGDVLTGLVKLWIDVFQEVHSNFRDVSFDWDHPDSALADMFIHPQHFDVVVALDVDADIISDFLSGLLHGTRAVTPSANVDPLTGFASFQTIHGSADALAGQNRSNPIGMIMATALMFEHSFRMSDEAFLLRKAVGSVLSDGNRTEDIVPPNEHDYRLVGTREMGEKIQEAICTIHEEAGVSA